MDNSHYQCFDTSCTITTRGGQGTFFLYLCGDYSGGILQVTGSDLISVRPFCASLYNCSDPNNCWMEDIRSGEKKGGYRFGVMAVSIMPGCTIRGESTVFDKKNH